VCELYGKVSPSKFGNVTLHEGDRIRLTTCGGGGYGDVAERPREMIAEDVREGYVSKEAAAARYGYSAAGI